ncbi:M42 family metallopeptidase [Pullulanibacillus pueri]|uniref:M42 family metallopeptidase n=1 Tax=Pullulanibacillus pueri TaxID=1437324 RepID=UPI0016641960|nr:M42 family metallopeptidase [Pullulanibacillus pueri]
MVEEKKIVDLITQLVSIPGPSGNASKAVAFTEEKFKALGVSTFKTNKGGLLATIEGKDHSKHRFLTAHVDTLGAMVKEIKSDGRLKLTKIGGFPWNMAEGEYCEIETAEGKHYTGTILIHQTSTHVYKDAGKAERTDENMEVRIDEKTTSKEETEALGIQVGDFVSFDPRVQVTESGFVKSRHLDDKASVALLLHVAEKLKENNITLPYTTHFLISNNEEIGFGGNSNIPEETVEYLAVDMGAIGDGQATDEYTVSICAKDSSGPYHYGLRKKLVQIAQDHHIGYKIDIYPYYGSDASAAIRAGFDIIHGLIGPGIDASHAYERTHVDSLLHTGDLIYYYLQSDLVEA